ncbi:MAG: hypothetical protein IKU15_05045 [Clostridia bacterium]|nr:hypothetical protein [Clostridia bacterium]
MNQNISRGFVTIATGNYWYYKIAYNLLLSYRYTTNNPLPFAIICDRENEITKEFDKIVLLDNATCSYIDKLRLGELSPFDETVFIDADSLAYDDLNVIFDIFSKADDFCCLGSTAPLTDEGVCWFSLSSFPEHTEQDSDIIDRETAKNKFTYAVNLHGGMYYIRKSEISRKVCSDAFTYAKDYSHYKFRMFTKPADEPVLALAMANNNCKPIPFDSFALECFWRSPYMKLNMAKKLALHKNNKASLVHWGTVSTKTAVYKKQIDQLYMTINNTKKFKMVCVNCINSVKCWFYYIRYFLYRLKRQILQGK